LTAAGAAALSEDSYDGAQSLRLLLRFSTATRFGLVLRSAKPKSVRFNDLGGVLAEVQMVDWQIDLLAT
jgi:hypothetical protein